MPSPKPEDLHCPVDDIPSELSFDREELTPLLSFLESNQVADQNLRFQRGTVTERQTLDCCKQDLGPIGAKLLSEALHTNEQIEAILFGTGGIGNEGAGYVAELMEKNRSIHTVYLGCNLIGEKGMKQLGSSLQSNPTIQALWLKRNPLGPAGAEAVANLLRQNRNIRTLDLVNTLIGSEGLKNLVQTIVETQHPLERLYLGGNQFSSQDARPIAQMLQQSTQLKELYLSVNQLGDQGVSEISKTMAANKSLERLSLASNGMTHQSLEGLLDVLKNHPSLLYLDLGYSRSTRVLEGQANLFSKKGASMIRDFLAENSHLRYLDIRKTGMGFPDLALVSEGLLLNHSLTDLLHSKCRKPWIKEQIRSSLERNRGLQPAIPIPSDIQTIKSVYR